MTNRDLYGFIAALVKRQSDGVMTLESYLENLRQLAGAYSDRAALPPSEFARLLEAAFGSIPRENPARSTPASGYRDWEKHIAEQIRDLHEMDEVGTLADKYRYFGVDAPRGARWYNFDPCTFLECAAAGTFGGWRNGDDTGRAYVPGQVAVVDALGTLTSMDPRDIDAPVVELPEITWYTFVHFLQAGQWYE